ncbi:phosphatase PAP2 family protein [Shewanella sp. KCT]|uniref:phosphatase PAP2 family protein n=1 Tax=Shewanella sp. KCT TaxID=2569535 RepID=UPI001183A552|nr:phosphatase PAP2 family protein [Shewanella sp. KCT]TVP13767.1 PA-phosphatase [Shewanella sp. KCT]
MNLQRQAKATGMPAQDKYQGRGFIGLLLLLLCLHLLVLNSAVNLSLFRFFNGIAAYAPADLLLLITDLGDGITLGVITLCCLVKRPELLLRVVIASVLSLILVPLLKQTFDAPRPAVILETLNIVGEIRLKHSFPSGHTATAFLFAGTLFFAYRQTQIKCLAITFASLVGLSRIVVGAHWPEDVIMGAFVGLFCAYAAAHCPLVKLTQFHKALILAFLWCVLVVSELDKSFDKDLIWPILMLRWGLIATAALLIWREYGAMHRVRRWLAFQG